MIPRSAFRPAAAVRGCTLAMGLLLACDVAPAAEPGISLRMTRAELQRTWDLDRNGTIDEGEAAVAASKMRQERARIGLRRTIDPVTGRLLDEETADAGSSWLEDKAAPRRSASRAWFERWSLQTAEAESPDPDADPGAGPSADGPSSRSRGLSLHGPIPGRTTLPTTAAGPPPAAARPWPTGGLQAGAEPARPGYGSGVTRDLNAGRPIDRTAAGRAAGTAGRAPQRVPAGPGAAAPGGVPAPRAASGGRTPGRPYDPY